MTGEIGDGSGVIRQVQVVMGVAVRRGVVQGIIYQEQVVMGVAVWESG